MENLCDDDVIIEYAGYTSMQKLDYLMIYIQTHAYKNGKSFLYLEEPAAAGYEANRVMHSFQ